jgi:hypothetical protein
MSLDPGASRVGKVNQRSAIVNRIGTRLITGSFWPLNSLPLAAVSICAPARSGAAFRPLTSRKMESPEKTIELLKRGGSQLINEAELKKKLEEGRALRVKFGVDPTSPDLHLGHSINLFKLRQFQDLGHLAVLIIGDFTSMVGDPSGRSTTRPMLTRAQVMVNAETYKVQAFKILDPARTEIVFNSEWLGKMNYLEVI